MKAYKRIFTAALKHKLNVLSVNLHMKHKTMKKTVKTASHSVTAKIKQIMNTV